MLVATLPILLLAAVDSQLSAAKREADGGARLHEAVTALSQHIEEYVANHAHAVQSLAAAMSDPTLSSPDRQRLVDAYPKIYPGFITLFAADRAGIVQEIFPPREAAMPPIADRQYFIDAMRNRRMTVSDVILGRLSHVPIITIAVPIVHASGDVTGVAGGSLDLSKFERFADDFRTLRRRAHHRSRSARSRDLRQRRRPASPRCRASPRTTSSSQQRASASNGVYRYRADDRRRQRLGAVGAIAASALIALARLEGLHRAAAADAPPAVDRLLRAHARR